MNYETTTATTTTTSTNSSSTTGSTATSGNTTTTTTGSTSTDAVTNTKYDRQLRLWGSNGQYHVSNTCIVLILSTMNDSNSSNSSSNSSNVGVETIKNCILPGIQHVHLMTLSLDDDDDDKDKEENMNHTSPYRNTEYSSNFFLTNEPSINNANNTNNNNNTTVEMMLQYLLELNPDVTGSASTFICHQHPSPSATTTTTGTTKNDNFTSAAATGSSTTSCRHNYNGWVEKLQELQSNHEHVICVGSDLDTTTIRTVTQAILHSSSAVSVSETASSSSSSATPPAAAAVKVDLSNVPFITVHSYGFIGIVQIQYLPQHPIVNPTGGGGNTSNNNTTTAVPDFRIQQPFPLLKEYMESFIETHFIAATDADAAVTTTDAATNETSTPPPQLLLTPYEYGNIPYPILLYHTYHYIWKRKYPTLQPSQMTMSHKKEFQSMIQMQYHHQTSRTSTTTTTTNSNDLPLNVQEAIKNSYLAYTPGRMVDLHHLQSLLSSKSKSPQRLPNENATTTTECDKFYITLQAMIQFMMANHDDTTTTSPVPPPVHGTIPDMTASTNAYIELQSIYKQQSNIDIAKLRQYMKLLPPPLRHDGAVTTTQPTTTIDDDYIRKFCYNVHTIDIIRVSRYGSNSDPSENGNNNNNGDDDKMVDGDDENNAADDTTNELSMILDEFTCNDPNEDLQIPLIWYIGFMACQLFNELHHRYPGTFGNNNNDDEDDEVVLLHDDAKELQQCIVQILDQGNNNNSKNDSVTSFRSIRTHPIIQRTLLQPHVSQNESGITTSTTTDIDLQQQQLVHTVVVPSKYAVEMVRYGNCEIHTIGSIIGGIAAQEIIKIITHQYVPIQNTYVYNGIASTGAVYNV